jgi:hypothetical protein
MALLTFYDLANNEIAKFPALVTEASWIENRPGRLVFNMPMTHEYFSYKIMKWGVKVTAKFEGFNYLWVGFIEPPRKWPQGAVAVNCRSMEYIFRYRRQRTVSTGGVLSAPLELKGTGGSLVQQILQIANSKRTTTVSPGQINMAGDIRQEIVNDTLDVHLRAIAVRTNHIWNVTGADYGGHLALALNYFPVRSTVIDYLIEEGVNLETQQTGDILVEDGDVFNDVLGTGDFGVQEEVQAYIAQDLNAMNEFGLRQTIEQFAGNVESDTIQRNATEFLNRSKDAVKTVNPVLPYTEEVASKLVLNTYLPIKLHSAGFKPDGSIGFDGFAPVRSITIDEDRKRISLLVGVEY